MDKKLREEIARVAYELYEKRGGVHGCDFEDWVEAERIVMARHEKKGKAGTTQAKTAVKKPPAPKKTASASGSRRPSGKKTGGS